jgi:two-component system, NarL family, sensor histidine kinase UhpB
MAQQFWQQWRSRTRDLFKPFASSAGPLPGDWASVRLNALGRTLLGVLVAWVLGWSVVALNRASSLADRHADSGDNVQVMRAAWVAPSASATFPVQDTSSVVPLPDEWARTRAGYSGSVWYRIHFDAAQAGRETLLGAYLERACATVEVQLNGQVLYRAGGADELLSRQCYEPHLLTLPGFLLRSGDNQLDIRVTGFALDQVTARQRAGGLGAVSIGAWSALRERADSQTFWAITVSQIIGGILLVLGAFAMGLAWVRRLPYLWHFGLLTLSWAALTGRLWFSSIPVESRWAEVLLAAFFTPMTAFAVKFLLGYAGHGLQSEKERQQALWFNRVLWAQVVLMPLSLLALSKTSWLFDAARTWYTLLGLEVLAAIVYFIWHAGRSRRAEFLVMSGTLGVAAALLGTEMFFQYRLMQTWGWNITYFVMPMLFAVVSFRLIQVYARALQTAEGARAQLEKRVQEISGEIERNFTQIAELRVEQIAEKERKRIAADLHDDLGAKLLTIVHTSDNDRISTLAREALEEMRLSVRGLTGRAMRLPDALADWRAEVVMRLGQAGIEVEWRHPLDVLDEPLSARTYVQTTRIIREAVSNIIKHSHASHVIITAEVGEHDFQVAIQDNGRGIPLELDGRLDRGHGMASMKHRAKQLNGQCLVESGPGFGTVIRMTLPLEIETVASVIAPGASIPSQRRSDLPPST